jgi:hypothetical protein
MLLTSVIITKKNGYQKMCDRNKNVIKMSVIIKGVYCTFTRTKKKKKSLCKLNTFVGFSIKDY